MLSEEELVPAIFVVECTGMKVDADAHIIGVNVRNVDTADNYEVDAVKAHDGEDRGSGSVHKK